MTVVREYPPLPTHPSHPYYQNGHNHHPHPSPTRSHTTTINDAYAEVEVEESAVKPTSPFWSRTARLLVFVSMLVFAAIAVFFLFSHFYGYDSAVQRIGSGKDTIGLFKREVAEVPNEWDQFRKDKQLRFVLIVFGWKRRLSLKRLVDSLKAAEYHGFPVDLEFHLDGEASPAVLEYVSSVEWQHGDCAIKARIQRVGLERAVMESWDAKDDKELAFFFEDDVEVSPFYFEYSLLALKQFWYNNESVKEVFAGLALNTPKYDEISKVHKLWTPHDELPKEELLFLFQLPCSWGSLYFPWFWREFKSYYQSRKQIEINDNEYSYLNTLPESSVNVWKRSWKRYLVEWMYMKGAVMLYPSMTEQASFSVHHREPGEHTQSRPIEPLEDQLGPVVVDYFTTPLIKDRSVVELIYEAIRKNTFDSLSIVNFHHRKARNLKELKELGIWTALALEAFGFDMYKWLLKDKITKGCLLNLIDNTVMHSTFKGNEGYLIYQPSDSLIQQLDSLENGLIYAKLLNRTLVVPDLKESINEDWLFYGASQQGISLIKWKDFKAIGRVERIVWFNPWSRQNFSIFEPKNDLMEFKKSRKIEIPAILGSVEAIQRHFGGCKDEVLAFRSMLRMVPFEMVPGVIDLIQPSQKVKEIIKNLRGELKGKFTCIDYSRGDDEEFCRMTENEGKLACMAGIVDLIKKNNLDDIQSIYLINQVVDKTQHGVKAENLTVLTLPLPNDPIDLAMLRMAELFLCTEHATSFIGHPFSLMTERIVQGRKGKQPANVIIY